MLGPPPPPVRFCSVFNDPRPYPPQRPYFLNDPFLGLAFLRNKRKELVVYLFSSTDLLRKMKS